MQVRLDAHKKLSIELKEGFEVNQRSLDEDDKRFFKLFTESTFEGSRATARKMKKIAERQITQNQEFLLSHSVRVLIFCSKSEMLSWPSSPLLVMLQLVDPNVSFGTEDAPLGEGASRFTLLHALANVADPFNYSNHVNQVILAKQLIERGANVNAVSIPQGTTPLHHACSTSNVTNLDFVELLLEEGADPNAQEAMGNTPLMGTIPYAPGAAKFLLNWPTTDVTITERAGASFLAMVRLTIQAFSYNGTGPDNPEMVQHQLLLQQWREIEDMLVERGAIDPGIAHSD
jgi:hypothetical protein